MEEGQTITEGWNERDGTVRGMVRVIRIPKGRRDGRKKEKEKAGRTTVR